MERSEAIRVLEAMKIRKLGLAKAPMPYLSRSEAASARDRHDREAKALGVVLALVNAPPGHGYVVSDRIARGLHVTRVEGDEYVCDRCHKRWGLDEREEPPCTD